MTHAGAASATARKPSETSIASIRPMPITRRMPLRSLTPQYCEINTLMPEYRPKPSRPQSQPHWAAMPTAESVTSPSCETISVSTSWNELVNTFCSATGTASFTVTRQKGLSPR